MNRLIRNRPSLILLPIKILSVSWNFEGNHGFLRDVVYIMLILYQEFIYYRDAANMLQRIFPCSGG